MVESRSLTASASPAVGRRSGNQKKEERTMSAIHFVGGEKGGVGKSVFARLLSQYCLDKGMHYAGLDADQSHATTSRYYEEFTKPLKLDEFESADAIMELALEREQQVVVDLPAQSQRFLNQWVDENGVVEMCESMGVGLTYWNLVDDSPDSLQLLKAFMEKYGTQMNILVVKNQGRGSLFSDVEDLVASYQSANPGTRVQLMDLPALHANTMFRINKLNLSFWNAVNGGASTETSLSLMEKQRTKVWLHKAYAEIDAMLLGLAGHPTESPEPELAPVEASLDSDGLPEPQPIFVPEEQN
jgi:hypothetical protein